MKKEIRHPDKQFLHGLFSAAVAVDGWLYISGAGPLDMATGEHVEGTIEEETRLTLGHIGTILAEAGASFSDVVKCSCFLADLADFEGFNRTYGEFFRDVRPARTTVQAGLMKNIKVEIDCVARLPQADPQ